MEFDKYLMETKTEDKISTLYNRMITILLETACLNECAMVVLHSKGYNGFKRWHRYRSREFREFVICLDNELFDKFHKTVKHEPVSISYAPANMNSHLVNWKEKLATAIHDLGECNKEYFALTGTTNCIVEDAIHILTRDYEKACRYYERFSEGDWLAHDMHVVDDIIHYKYKKKEEEHGYKY